MSTLTAFVRRHQRTSLAVGGFFLAAALVAVGLSWWSSRADAQAKAKAAQQKDDDDFFEGGIAWINSDNPIKSGDLKGRVVLLDFWTLCCINCIHTLPDLAKLEAKYPGVLVVVGVHTPKFPNEKKTASIQKAVQRYQVKHPVINDAETAIWRRFRVNSWPTLVLIDPEGKVYGRISGEGGYEILDQHISKLVKEHRKKKTLKETPIEFVKARADKSATPLFFPGKVLADAAGKRLFIADSTNNRIVITDLEGKKIAVAGTGVEGKADGPFDKATFSDPQGMALVGDTLYVADRKNHMIRALDLKAKTVRVVAGIGEQDRTNRGTGGPALKTGLNSPWDLLLHDKIIYVAMAGHHQIWTFDPGRDRVDPYAGDGRENIQDGSLAESEFAQPSGLATDGKRLYVADSEVSAIRSVALPPGADVKTVVGEGLFEFGDVDGQGSKVRLQHALGVAYRGGKLYVADTYNSKIKVIDPEKRTCKTFRGEGKGWLSPTMFNEPGGLSFAGDKLYVADTNAHRIQVIDMQTGGLTTLPLQGVEPVRRREK
jgi:DNA-binding beta-propeller fold protein YncE